MKHVSMIHKIYYEWLMTDCIENKKCPIYFIRFEDLLSQPAVELDGLFKFLLDMDTLEGTNVERRINLAVDKGKEASQTYTLKKTTG